MHVYVGWGMRVHVGLGGGVVCERMVWGDGCEYGMWGGGNISIEQMSQNNLLPQGKILTKS